MKIAIFENRKLSQIFRERDGPLDYNNITEAYFVAEWHCRR